MSIDSDENLYVKALVRKLSESEMKVINTRLEIERMKSKHSGQILRMKVLLESRLESIIDNWILENIPNGLEFTAYSKELAKKILQSIKD